MKTELRDKWVLITGASSGFGAAASRAFGAEGAQLLLGARRVDRLETVAAEARKSGAAAAHLHFLDVSKTSSVEEFMGWARAKIAEDRSGKAKLDILINNAGGALGLDTVAEGKDEDWEAMMQTNVLGVLRMTRAALPLMVGHPGGPLLNIGSTAGPTAYEGRAAYLAAEAGELQTPRA